MNVLNKILILSFFILMNCTVSFAFLPTSEFTLGGITAWQTMDDVHRILGIPAKSIPKNFFADSKKIYLQDFYDNNAVIITYENYNGKWRISSIECTSPDLSLTSGIKVGNDIYDVYRLYGKPAMDRWPLFHIKRGLYVTRYYALKDSVSAPMQLEIYTNGTQQIVKIRCDYLYNYMK